MLFILFITKAKEVFNEALELVEKIREKVNILIVIYTFSAGRFS